MSDIIMFPSKDPNTHPICVCPACGFHTFLEAWQIRQMPGIIFPTGQNIKIPIGPMYMCLNRDCGQISAPSQLVSKKVSEVKPEPEVDDNCVNERLETGL